MAVCMSGPPAPYFPAEFSDDARGVGKWTLTVVIPGDFRFLSAG